MYITLSTEQAVDICMDHKVFGEFRGLNKELVN